MPYIKKSRRREMWAQLAAFFKVDNSSKLQVIKDEFPPAEYPGDLSFQITALVLGYIERHGLRYDTLATVDGILGLTQAEFRRRLVYPYEDKKCAENGDVGYEDLLNSR